MVKALTPPVTILSCDDPVGSWLRTRNVRSLRASWAIAVLLRCRENTLCETSASIASLRLNERFPTFLKNIEGLVMQGCIKMCVMTGPKE